MPIYEVVVDYLVKQRGLGQSAAEADWIIGEGLFTAKVHGVGLRSMKAPGTAYDDPVLGKDPQPAHMKNYVETAGDAVIHTVTMQVDLPRSENLCIPAHACTLAVWAAGPGGTDAS